MLDTRKIQAFIDPQILIWMSNAWTKLHQFNDWGRDSVNLIVSELLQDHIKRLIREDDNLNKLYKTMLTMGMKRTHQFLILTMTGKFALFEPDGDKSTKVIFGEMGKTVEPIIFAVCRCLFQTNLEIDPSGGPVVMMEEIVSDRSLVTRKPGLSVQDAIADTFSAYCNFFLYLQFVETEVVTVEPKQKFRAKKYEGFKNQQPVSIRVADLSWSKEYIASVPSTVVGHLRQQPCGPGRLERKLIYIEPFTRTYHRSAVKDRIIKS